MPVGPYTALSPATAIRIRRRLFATMYVTSYAIVNMLVQKARYQVSHLVC